jgi:glycogen synthase
MKIFLSTDTVGGVWDYTRTLSEELIAAGHEVLLAVLGEPTDRQRATLPREVRVEARSFRLEWMPGSAVDVEMGGAWLAETARAWGADVAHLNQMAYTVHDFGAPTLVVVHSDVLSWFGEVRGEEAPAEWEEYRSAVTRGIEAADWLVTPTEYQSALTRRHYGRAADRVIHNGVRAPLQPPAAPPGPLLLSVGRAWDEAKGMRTFDEAVGLLADRAPPAHLLGEEIGPDGQRFTARHLSSHGGVGRLAVDRWMATATTYVGASSYEPFGLAPLEAAMQGTALLLADIGSFRELWGGCAEFFPVGDAAALAERIVALHDASAGWREIATACRDRASSRYTAERFAAGYLALYEQMAN